MCPSDLLPDARGWGCSPPSVVDISRRLNGLGDMNARDRSRSRPRHMTEHPPHSITSDVLTRVEQTGEAIGRVEATGIARDGA